MKYFTPTILEILLLIMLGIINVIIVLVYSTILFISILPYFIIKNVLSAINDASNFTMYSSQSALDKLSDLYVKIYWKI